MVESARKLLQQHYPEIAKRASIEEFNSTGFSGATIWCVTTPDTRYAWRLWPKNYDRQRLIEQHRLLHSIKLQGIDFVPAPSTTQDGLSVVINDERLWQLEPWMPGQADFWQNSNTARIRSAFRALAQCHLAASRIEWRGEWFRSHEQASSPTVTSRINAFKTYSATVMQQLDSAIKFDPQPKWCEIGAILLTALRGYGPQLIDNLKVAESWTVPIQPVLRDVWHDHLLFTDDNVTGLIDFGAASSDSVTVDLSRLLSSLIGRNVEQRRIALDAYESARPLSATEHKLVPLLEQSNVILSGLTWLRRRYLEHQKMVNAARVLDRLERIVDQLDYTHTLFDGRRM